MHVVVDVNLVVWYRLDQDTSLVTPATEHDRSTNPDENVSMSAQATERINLHRAGYNDTFHGGRNGLLTGRVHNDIVLAADTEEMNQDIVGEKKQ